MYIFHSYSNQMASTGLAPAVTLEEGDIEGACLTQTLVSPFAGMARKQDGGPNGCNSNDNSGGVGVGGRVHVGGEGGGGEGRRRKQEEGEQKKKKRSSCYVCLSLYHFVISSEMTFLAKAMLKTNDIGRQKCILTTTCS